MCTTTMYAPIITYGLGMVFTRTKYDVVHRVCKSHMHVCKVSGSSIVPIYPYFVIYDIWKNCASCTTRLARSHSPMYFDEIKGVWQITNNNYVSPSLYPFLAPKQDKRGMGIYYNCTRQFLVQLVIRQTYPRILL